MKALRLLDISHHIHRYTAGCDPARPEPAEHHLSGEKYRTACCQHCPLRRDLPAICRRNASLPTAPRITSRGIAKLKSP